MHIDVRVRRWVMWWFWVGVVCGGIAVANILGRDLTHAQERLLLLIGALHWLLGGIVCWAFEGVRANAPAKPQKSEQPRRTPPLKEWHAASEFLLPGRRQSVLPWSQAVSGRRRRYVRDFLRASDARRSH